MRSLNSSRWIATKGVLFLCLGCLSSALLFLEHPTTRVGLLLALTVWSFCRFYYFAFYVMKRHVDADYEFSGLGSLASHLIRKGKRTRRA
jgi:hypothetical protein